MTRVEMTLRSLRSRINLAIFTTCLIISIFFVAILYPFEANRREARLQNIKILLSAIYQQKKEELANEIFADQKLALESSLQEMQRVKGIAALTVYDPLGRLVLSTEENSPATLSESERQTLDDSSGFSKKIIKGHPLAEYSTPIEVIGERIGYMKMHYNLAEMQRESLFAMVIFFILLFSTLLIMAVFLNLFLSRSVITPVAILRKAIGRVKKGHFGEQVKIASRNEMGDMAQDFNDMSSKLLEQHVEIEAAIKAKDSNAHKLKKVNNKLEELNASLEDIVNERTAELRRSNARLLEEIEERKRVDRDKKDLEERLSRSQKMEALGLLAGGVAHDLNNVLSGIVSYPDLLLLDLPEESPYRHPVMTIKQSGQKAAAIVQDLLDLARRGVMNREVVNLNDIVSEYLNSPECERLKDHHSGVIIETHLAEHLLNVKGSPMHLKKTLMNLASNAAEAQPRGGRIMITTKNQTIDQPMRGYDKVVEGDYVVLSVQDKGTGIAPEDLKRIFEPFYTKKVMGRSGTGLGMAVVWGTLQDHQGYIDVNSREGVGSTFDLYFPVTRDSLPGERTAVPLEDYQGHSETVLVVDDIAEQREIALNILTKLGYSVITASSGEEAVQYMAHHSADLMILDMIMDPGIDGLDTYKKVLTLHPRQKAIIASGFSETHRVREAQALGVGKYLKKPYTLENLGLTVKEELGRTACQGK